MIPLDFILMIGLMMASCSNSAHLIYIYMIVLTYHIGVHTFGGDNLGIVFSLGTYDNLRVSESIFQMRDSINQISNDIP